MKEYIKPQFSIFMISTEQVLAVSIIEGGKADPGREVFGTGMDFSGGNPYSTPFGF